MITGLYSVSGPKRCQLRMLKLLCMMSLSYRDALLKKKNNFFLKANEGCDWVWILRQPRPYAFILSSPFPLRRIPSPLDLSISPSLASPPLCLPMPFIQAVYPRWQPHWSNWWEKYSHRIQTGYGDPLNPFFFFMFSKILSPYRKWFYAQISYFSHGVI